MNLTDKIKVFYNKKISEYTIKDIVAIVIILLCTYIVFIFLQYCYNEYDQHQKSINTKSAYKTEEQTLLESYDNTASKIAILYAIPYFSVPNNINDANTESNLLTNKVYSDRNKFVSECTKINTNYSVTIIKRSCAYKFNHFVNENISKTGYNNYHTESIGFIFKDLKLKEHEIYKKPVGQLDISGYDKLFFE